MPGGRGYGPPVGEHVGKRERKLEVKQVKRAEEQVFGPVAELAVPQVRAYAIVPAPADHEDASAEVTAKCEFDDAGATDGPSDVDSGAGFRDFVDYNVEAEALGYVSSFLVEHHFTGFGQVSATLNLLTWVGARTTTLRLGTAVISLPWRGRASSCRARGSRPGTFRPRSRRGERGWRRSPPTTR